MPGQFDKRKTSDDLLRQVLLDYLRASRVVRWPGADGLTDDDIVDCYPTAISAGDVPGWNELQTRFPELVGELHALRAAKGWLEAFPTIPANDREPEPNLADAGDHRLSRWLVSYASESGWYRVGEFIALDAAAAIERAVAIFGHGAAYQAEEIPWDAAPLSKVNLVNLPTVCK